MAEPRRLTPIRAEPAAPAPARPPAEPAPPDSWFTLMIVPERGHGKVWQVSLSLRRVRQVVAMSGLGLTLVLLALVTQLVTLPRVLTHDTLLAENVTVKAELADLQRELDEIDAMVERVRAYDERLRELGGRGLLPGFGPMDAEENDAWRAWLNGEAGSALVHEVAAGAETPLQRADRVAREIVALQPEIQQLSEPIEQWAALEGALPHVWPADGVVTSLFGWRRSPFNRRWKFHSGIDIGAHTGTPILATSPGVVVFSDWYSGYGRMVEVDHGSGITSRSCHASRLLVAVGDEVEAGDTIALVGSSGQSTGAHLHYELLLDGEQVDPLDYLPRGE